MPVEDDELDKVVRAKHLMQRFGYSQATAYLRLQEIKNYIRSRTGKQKVEVTLRMYVIYMGVELE